MRRVWADLVAYGKQYLRSPTATFFTLAFPILLILVFGAVFTGSEELEVTLHVQDRDDTATSRGLLTSLNETGFLSLVRVSPAEDLEAYVLEQDVVAALEIPAGFEAQVLAALGGSPVQPQVVLYGDPSNSAFQAAQGAVFGAVTGFNFVLAETQPIVGVGLRSVARETLTFIDFLIPGIIGITILTPLFATASLSAEYRERHYFKLLATTPLGKGEWLLSRTLWLLLLIFVSVAFMLLTARLVFGSAFAFTPTAAALVVSGTVLFTSLGLAIGNYVHEMEAANAVANVVYFPMMFLSGTFWPIEIMPDFIQPVARLLPLSFVNDGLRDTLIFANTAGALGNLAIVAGLAVVIFLIAALSMSWRVE
ncbi:MAG: ABC transporter permease [Thermoplasmata archaeon]